MPRRTKIAKKPVNRSSKQGASRSSARGTSGAAASRAGKSTAGKTKAHSSSSKLSKTTTDHAKIQNWAESRNAHPACVKGAGRKKNDTGMIRMDLPGFSGKESLQEISWDEFFNAFDENDLAFLYQEKTAGGKKSNFNKFVSR